MTMITRRIDRISQARSFVNAKQPFTNKQGNVYGCWMPSYNNDGASVYAVFSYGEHYPMYIWDPAISMWFGNKDNYSRTTARHLKSSLPTQDIPAHNWLDTRQLKGIIYHGGLNRWLIDQEHARTQLASAKSTTLGDLLSP